MTLIHQTASKVIPSLINQFTYRCQTSVVAMTTAISLMLNGSYSKNDGQDVAMITKEAYKTAKEILPKKSSVCSITIFLNFTIFVIIYLYAKISVYG